MFIWTAVDVDDELCLLKEEAKRIEQIVDFKQSNITLPLHVSLKISANVAFDDMDLVIDELTSLFNDYKPFEMDVDRIELHETISWLKIEENDILNKLHTDIVNLFVRHGIEPHEFDKTFKFHSTLFLDNDVDKVKKAFMQIREFPIPRVLHARKFVIGTSQTGLVGSYSVLKEINI